MDYLLQLLIKKQNQGYITSIIILIYFNSLEQGKDFKIKFLENKVLIINLEFKLIYDKLMEISQNLIIMEQIEMFINKEVINLIV